MPAINDTPKPLKPYICHGLDLRWKPSDDDAFCECPFCTKPKFSVKIEDGQWRCFSCNSGHDTPNGKASQGGNIYTFLRLLHQQSMSNTSEKEYQSLAAARRLLDYSTLIHWGVCKSIITNDWMIPGYDASSRLNQLYKWVRRRDGKRHEIHATSELTHQIAGVQLYDEKKSQVYIAEGCWDGMVLWETLSKLKAGKGDNYAITDDIAESYLQDINVIAVPSAANFNEKWHPLLANKDITFFFDSDHPRYLCSECKKTYSIVEHPNACPGCNKKRDKKVTPIPPAGYSGTKRTCQLLSTCSDVPKSVSYLRWGTPEEPAYLQGTTTGYDIRDFLTTTAPSKGSKPLSSFLQRGALLSLLLDKVEPIPKEWVQGAAKSGTVTLATKQCTNWNILRNAYQKAMHWGDGMDIAFSCMLASIMSVRVPEDQLWLLVLSPPSCLDGDTPIYDPVDDTTVSVKERWESGKEFSVYSLLPTGEIGVCRALPPVEFPVTAMYELETESGSKITVSAGHRIWNGFTYVSPRTTCKLPFVSKKSIGTTSNRPVESEYITSITYVGERHYYDFCVPETNNYWACGLFHHNTGKTSLCNGLAISRKHVKCVDHIRGVMSGYKHDKSGSKDFGLIPLIEDKALIMKDGDTFLKIPNFEKVMSELRALYDTNTSSHYLQGAGREYSNKRTVIIICGTDSLHQLDDSELGQRFLTVSIMDAIDDDFEDNICLRAINRLIANKGHESNGKPEEQHGKQMIDAMQLAGGYVEYLRKNAQRLLDELYFPDEYALRCRSLAKFIAYMRARPPRKQKESQNREMAARLSLQVTKLALCLGVVLGKKQVDEEVLRRVRKVTLDSSKGQTAEICRWLRRHPKDGVELRGLTVLTGHSTEELHAYLRFLKRIGIVEQIDTDNKRNIRSVWRMTYKFTKMYDAVIGPPRERMEL